MQTGEIIRRYRKNINMTQEEMAKRLGVTAPAVNKWENFSESDMYAHMKFKGVEQPFYAQVRKNLLKFFRDKETFSYMNNHAKWEELIGLPISENQ